MALDFSKFILPSPSADWLSKVPEYNALGRKAATSKDPEKENFDKLLQNAVYGKPIVVKDASLAAAVPSDKVVTQ